MAQQVQFPYDAVQGRLKLVRVTLSTAETETVVTLPNEAEGFRLYPSTNDVRFAVDETPATLATSSATTIAATAFGAGGLARAESWTPRTIREDEQHTLHLKAAVDSTVVDIEVF